MPCWRRESANTAGNGLGPMPQAPKHNTAASGLPCCLRLGRSLSFRAPHLGSEVATDLDKVLVRIQAVERLYGPAGPGLGDGPLHYLDPVTGELGHDQIQGPAGDEAEIPRADTGPITRLLPQQLQVDLLVAEAQRPPPRS